MNETFYSIEDGSLVISRGNPPLSTALCFEEGGVLDARVVPGLDGIVVLLEPAGVSNARPLRNLIFVRPDGSRGWVAELPAGIGFDMFVGFESGGDGTISAWTWSGNRLTLQADSGEVLESEFTK
ncbi:MAG: hypothetical protein ACT4P1_03715 [Sporichthyaceae bacterium]